MNFVDPGMIHKKLLFRICSMGLILAIVVGMGVWQMEKNKIGQGVLLNAKSGFKHFNNQIRPLLNHPGNFNRDLIRQQLVSMMGERRVDQLGGFVSMGIYTLKGELVTLVTDDGYDHMELVRDKTGRLNEKINTYKTMKFSVIQIKGIPHMQIFSSLGNDLGAPAAYGETFFALAPETLKKVRSKAIKVAGAAVFIVILTTGLLYPMVVTLLNHVSSLSAKLFQANLEILKVLGSAVAKRDTGTDSHNYRVTIISVKLAENLGLSKQMIQRLIKGAFLHDVGKIGIEDDILQKPGRLTEDEFRVMKKHVPYGVDIVAKAEWIKEAIDIVGCHHEKYDGSGYCNGLKGEQIPKIAKIFSIADVFDALTSCRPYKEPFSFEKTMDIIRAGRGNHFDPAYVDAFEKIAFSLFENYATREDNKIKTELAAIIKEYFYT
ncbi:MAG: HD-GYP domain-containing protein [Desulfobacteraceae bacterium]|nr:HD-GYP domain-containing protein [Desulfobacteraceae bacterium]